MDADALDGAGRAVWACDLAAEFKGITDLRSVHAAQADHLRRQLPHPLEVPVDTGPNQDGKYRIEGRTAETNNPNTVAVYCCSCGLTVPNTTPAVFFDGRPFLCRQCGKLLAGRGKSGEAC